MKQKYLLIPACCALLLSVSGCAGSKDEEPTVAASGQTESDNLYNKASAAMDEGSYVTAAGLFEDVERQFPYSKWAIRAEIMSAYAYYKGKRYDEAVLALDRFIDLHPGNDDVDYAYYLRALCFYEQISDVSRDQAMTEEALSNLDTLVRRFPDSKYSREARYKRDLTLDHLAGKDMDIGRYYLTRGHVNAAINRFRSVVMDYQTTTHIPEALHRLVESYLTLGLKGEATRVAAVLGHNYPGSKWYEATYKLLDPQQRQKILEERSWIDRTVESLFNPN